MTAIANVQDAAIIPTEMLQTQIMMHMAAIQEDIAKLAPHPDHKETHTMDSRVISKQRSDSVMGGVVMDAVFSAGMGSLASSFSQATGISTTGWSSKVDPMAMADAASELRNDNKKQFVLGQKNSIRNIFAATKKPSRSDMLEAYNKDLHKRQKLEGQFKALATKLDQVDILQKRGVEMVEVTQEGQLIPRSVYARKKNTLNMPAYQMAAMGQGGMRMAI